MLRQNSFVIKFPKSVTLNAIFHFFVHMLLFGGQHLVHASQILSWGEVSVCTIPVLELDPINLSC